MKLRTALAAKDGTRWKRGVALLPYGLWHLADHRGQRHMVLVEGESDCWTAWMYGVPALGIPGAKAAGSLTAEMLVDIDRIDVLQERDAGGVEFVQNVRRRLVELGWSGDARVFQLPTKDLSDLHVTRGQEFMKVVSEALANGTPIDSAVGGANETWPAPRPLHSSVASPRPFDPDMLPAAISPWVVDVADRMGCALEYVAAGTLVALGAVVGRRVGVRPKQLDDFTLPANLWGAIVGDPSRKKSPALAAALAPLEKLEDDARRAFAAAQPKLELEKTINKERRGAIDKDIRNALAAGTDPSQDPALVARMAVLTQQQPGPQRYMTTDVTVEQLCVLLAQNPNGILMQRDELTGWIDGFEREGREQDRKFFLEAWSGSSSFYVDRVGRGHLHVPACCVSIIGTIQPDLFADLIRRAARGGLDRDGFVARFQILVSPETNGDHRGIDRVPDAAAAAAAQRVFADLGRSDAGVLGADVSGPIPFLRFAPDAQYVHDVWLSELHETLGGERSDLIRAHLAKYASLMPKLALQFHLVDVVSGAQPPGPIAEAAAIRAMRLTENLESHARKVYGEALRSGGLGAHLLGHLKMAALAAPVTAADLHRRNWSGFSAPETLKVALAELVEAGYARERARPSSGRGGRPTVEYVFHPSLRGTG